ncbi:malto-oligosyltrehalose trehalohydrolase [Pelagibacterium sp. H642]|uniref:malto-oligosyltrehalose trehalohydrolase n=1 Tax=Pelagibacterium sp. H642 TaxID=1881069 RepID=UPI0028161BC8|nr:malto-oligosyltrehalose trehalohydrolase [Pelagibacterium sp. H642]WMT92856.1 malto-oligosyltrehalose trehalohydrolase [Pelagibacterium sp. H642]
MAARKWGPVQNDQGWTISTWAPQARSVTLLMGNDEIACVRCSDGFWSAETDAPVGASYKFRVDEAIVPDPASRLQQGDVHGASVLFDHDRYRWKQNWHGRNWAEAVIYELHVGTFTLQGNFAAAAAKLGDLASIGITAIEVMPVGQFPGTFGWGYDGVLPFAPHPAYGTPDDFKAFVDQAHGHGIMVLLDVVMNHFGPEGAYIHQSAPNFFDPDRHTPWGAAIDFSQEAVRQFWVECAQMWLADYHLDGLRLDAVHQIAGPGAEQFFDELAEAVRILDLGRPLHIVLEDERNEPHLREIEGLTANWNDDFHHAVHTALTGEDHDYYQNFAVDPIGDLVLALKNGHIEEGQERLGCKRRRGQPSRHLPPTAFVNATQTHDQVGNRPYGERLITLADETAVEVAFALLLVSPYIPMVFMGEEQGESTPFQYFADFDGELGRLVREGRASEFADIALLGEAVPDPTSAATFHSSKLSWSETDRAKAWQEMTRRCLAFRSKYVVPLLKSGRIASDAKRSGEKALEAEWHFAKGSLRLGLNLGTVGQHTFSFQGAQFRINALDEDRYALCAKAEMQ